MIGAYDSKDIRDNGRVYKLRPIKWLIQNIYSPFGFFYITIYTTPIDEYNTNSKPRGSL
jgi:hypothetical protein